MRRRVDRIASAHAVADAADDVGAGSRLLVSIGEQGFGILHHQRDVDRVHQLEHALALGRFRICRQRPQLHHARAVIQVRQHHVIARGTEPARHVAQFLADRRRVHIKDDDGVRTAALGMGDERGGVAVLGRNFDLLVDHGVFLYRYGFAGFLPGADVDTIARKLQHDKPTGSCADNSGLEQRAPDRHCLTCRPLRNRPGDF